jgi:hypothetical protein
VDAAPALAAWLTTGRHPPMPLAFRAPTDPTPDDDGPDDAPPPGVLPLDDAARARLARRRRR